MLTLFLIGLWLVCGFFAARGSYFSFIEFTSVGGPVWGLTSVLFIAGPLGVFVAISSDWEAFKAGLRNDRSPNPTKHDYVSYFGMDEQFERDLAQWNRLRSWLLIPEWETVEVEKPFDYSLYRF